jgi:hypothetical protein
VIALLYDYQCRVHYLQLGINALTYMLFNTTWLSDTASSTDKWLQILYVGQQYAADTLPLVGVLTLFKLQTDGKRFERQIILIAWSNIAYLVLLFLMRFPLFACVVGPDSSQSLLSSWGWCHGTSEDGDNIAPPASKQVQLTISLYYLIK